MANFYALTFQTAAVATGNGTANAIYGQTVVTVQVRGITTATITWEGTVDGTNWVALLGTNLGTGAQATTATADGLYQVNVAGVHDLRARISAWTSGTITVTGIAVSAAGGVGGSAAPTTPILLGAGTASAPAYSFAAGTTTGVIFASGTVSLGIVANGSLPAEFSSTTLRFASGSLLGWNGSSNNPSGSAVDVTLRRLAAGALARTEAIPGNANYGAFSIGSGPFDGSTAGFFVGSSSGTGLAINAASGYGGDLIHAAIAGVSQLVMTGAGLLHVGSSGSDTARPTLGIVSGEARIGAKGQFASSGANFNPNGAISLVTSGAGLTLSNGSNAGGFINLSQQGSVLVKVWGPGNSTVAEVSQFQSTPSAFTITGAIATQRFSLFAQPTITAATAQTVTNAATLAIADAPLAAGSAVLTNAYALWVQAGASRFSGRLHKSQGGAVAAANNLALGTDGNQFHITGATQINLLDNSNWQGGAEITLIFDSTPTVKHNQAASGNNKPLMLNGGVDLVAAVDNTLTLTYDSTNSKWYETSRKV